LKGKSGAGTWRRLRESLPAAIVPIATVSSNVKVPKREKAAQPALRNDADAITRAIARMKQDLRGGGGDDGGPTAA
jgi:hypothetical protein